MLFMSMPHLPCLLKSIAVGRPATVCKYGTLTRPQSCPDSFPASLTPTPHLPAPRSWLDAGIRAEVRCAAAGEDAAACAAVAGALPVNGTLWESYRDMRPSWMRPKGAVNGTGAGGVGGGGGGSGPRPTSPRPARAGSSGSPPSTNSGGAAAAWRPLVLSVLAATALTLAAHLAAA